MDVGKMFELDSLQLKVDDKLVASHLYSPLEVQALHRGGMQRVYLGNLKAGTHEVVAFFTGKGPHFRDYKRAATLKFEKGADRPTSSCASLTPRPSCSPSSTSRFGNKRAGRAPGIHLRHCAGLLGWQCLCSRTQPQPKHWCRRRTTATRCSSSSRTTTSAPSPG